MMCTAIFMKEEGLFGRTLDLEYSYNETVTITPKGTLFTTRASEPFTTQHAIIGMAYVKDNYPLYYDAVNDAGLAVAGLNFPRSARYSEPKEGCLNLTPFEIIPYTLGTCKSVRDVKDKFQKLNIVNIPFSEDLPLTPLHWMIADKGGALVLEATEEGLRLYDNDIGVMANEPPFPYHRTRLEDFASLSSKEGDALYSRGLSAYGLPGDFSSVSRFVRGTFLLKNSVSENKSPTQFFKITDSLSVPRGAVKLKNGKNVITHYACCMDMEKGIYYYKTYLNSRICAVSLRDTELTVLKNFPLRKEEDILFE